VRRLKKIIIIFFLFIVFALANFALWLDGKYVAPIIMYHSVNYTSQFAANVVTPENFEYQMSFIRRNNYHPLSLDELIDLKQNSKPIPWKSLVITFDDGFEDIYTHAFKILKKYQIPATVFVITARIGKEGYLNWAQIREMAEYGIDIGSHTKSHLYLPDKNIDVATEEVTGSKKDLEEKLGREVNFISYPVGGFSEEIKTIVKNAGYRGACATNRGYDRFNRDVFELNRVRFSNNDNKSIFLFWKLTGFYNLLRNEKAPH